MNRSRIVRWLRILLPLIALAMLSTMFLFSRKPDAESQIPYTEVDAEQMAREPRLVAPQYAGVTADGAELSLSAGDATPGGAGTAGAASDLRLDWRRPDGLQAGLSAPAVGVSDGVISLSGGVRMTTSSGWSLEASRIDASTDRSRLAAEDGVTGTAPFGRVSAGRMELVPAGDGTPDDGAAAGAADGPSVLNFSGGVRLIYQP